ncbi:MAG: hypothetical protein ACOX5R_14915 [bacterium]|jgi:hypothetical protein
MTKITSLLLLGMAFLSFMAFIGLASSYAQSLFVDLNRVNDWQPLHDIDEIRTVPDGLALTAGAADPYIMSRPLYVPASDYQAIIIEMKTSAGSQGQIFWTNAENPNFVEAASARFQLQSDNQFHTYVLTLANHEKWQGTIQVLRLDPTDLSGEVVIRSFKIVDRIGARVKLISFQPSAPFVMPEEPFHLTANFENSGDEPGFCVIQLTVENPKGREIVQREVRQEIAPGTVEQVKFPLEFDESASYTASCDWYVEEKSMYVDESEGKVKCHLLVFNRETENPEEIAQITTPDWKVSLPKTELGYGAVCFQMKQKDVWRDVAWTANLGKISMQLQNGKNEEFAVFTDRLQQSEHGIGIQREWQDEDGIQWNYELSLELITEPLTALHVRGTLSSDGGKLLRLWLPEIFVGEKSFGREKDLAILPGIEYLTAEAVSSSSEVAHPPVRDQYIPHPGKITVPVMALTRENMLFALLWRAQAEWAEGEKNLSPVFSVPNRLYEQNNHLMGLFVPSVPDYAAENQMTGSVPYEMKAGQPVEMECWIYMNQSTDPIDAIQAWNGLFHSGTIPEPLPAPRDYAEELAVSRIAYMDTCWNAEEKGWGHCVGWKAYPSGGMLALLEMDRLLSDDVEIKQQLQERIRLVYDTLVEKHGAGALGVAAGCHVMLFEPGFFWGVTEQALEIWWREANNLLKSQNPDGSWGFHPRNEQQRMLGEEGMVVSGTIAPEAMYLMRLARITGDAELAEAGLRGVQALNRRRVPRGSQHWECPLAAPDIMVSGYGARANLDAYRITGDENYLKEAVYWARTGLAFHYLWNLPEHPLQRYATIPIFGTTFFTHSWLGVPVQWCGLVYAYCLLELAEFDNSCSWEKLARGIVNSGIHQQLTEGPYAGTLPDSYGDYFKTARGAYINPENIMTPLHDLEGNSLNIRTKFIDGIAPDARRISTNADIEALSTDEDGFTFTINLMSERVSETMLTPMERSPKQVLINGEEIQQYENLFEVENGWRYNAGRGMLFIHAKHAGKPLEVEVRM